MGLFDLWRTPSEAQFSYEPKRSYIIGGETITVENGRARIEGTDCFHHNIIVLIGHSLSQQPSGNKQLERIYPLLEIRETPASHERKAGMEITYPPDGSSVHAMLDKALHGTCNHLSHIMSDEMSVEAFVDKETKAVIGVRQSQEDKRPQWRVRNSGSSSLR